MKMNQLIKIYGFLILIFCNASCSNDHESIDSSFDNEVVLIINKEKVTTNHFKKVTDRQKRIFKIQDIKVLKAEELVWLKNRVLDEIIKNTLLAQEIKNNNISVEEDILNASLEKTREGYRDDTFIKTLKSEGVSVLEWKNSIKTNLLINKLIQQQVNSKVTIGDKELHEYYIKNIKKFHKKEQVRALHIMVETEDEIRQIQKELKGKQKTFSRLAEEFSLGPEGSQGGDLGYFESGQMPEEFDDVFKLNKGKVSDIIKTPYGFHLFQVVDKIEERKMGYDESKSIIKKTLIQDLQDKGFQDWFIKIKQNSRIDVNYEILQKIY
tara:strand:- start:2298 stop:3269 length:972 start_codon:yes stop_codon:yes gene_type:complete